MAGIEIPKRQPLYMKAASSNTCLVEEQWNLPVQSTDISPVQFKLSPCSDAVNILPNGDFGSITS